MKKINSCALGLLASIIFVTSGYPAARIPVDKDVKEALIKKDLGKVKKIVDSLNDPMETTPIPYFLLTYVYYAKGDYQKIPQLLNTIDTPDKKEFLLAWAQEFAREYPQSSIPYLLKGDAYLRLKKYDEAIKEFDTAEAIDANLFLIYAAKGMFYAFQSEYDLAIKNFTRGIKLEPRSADLYNSRGIVYYCQGDYALAIDDFSQAIKINPKFTLAYLGRCKVYRAQGKDGFAAIDFKRAQEIDQEGFAISRSSIKDPATGKVIHKFKVGLDIKPEIKTPEGKLYSFGRIQGVDSRPEGEIIILKDKGVVSEKTLDDHSILPALYFLLHNDQFFFKTERGR
ncbi:MAG: tetratricopeptide repeat protein [Candidatus Omnitrophica bacterium]|nr:tetratricopeptide repeat protein [Candidatus Omnitrophota bacterium]